MAGSVVWVDVLPSGNKWGPAVEKIATAGAAKAGVSAGAALDEGLAKSAKSGGGAARFFGGVAKTGLRATGAIVGGVAAIGGAIATVAAKKGLDRLVDIDSAQAKLKGLKMSTQDIATVMDSALASVKGTAFGLGDAATVASSAVAAGIKPGEELTKYLKLTADTASIAGVSLGEMGSIINKTTTSGKVYTDSLNQLADRGIPIFGWLQKEYGVSAEKLSAMVQKGQVDSATFRKVIEQNIGGAALASGDSVRGAYANMGAALGRLGAMFLAGPMSAAPDLFTSLTNALDRAGVALKPLADRFDEFSAVQLYKVATWVDTIDFGKAFSTAETWVTKAISWFRTLGEAMRSGDSAGLGASFGSLLASLKPLMPVGQAVLNALGPLAGTISGLLVSAIGLAKPALEGFTQIFTWLGQHTELIVPILIAVGAGFLAMRAGQAAARVTAVAMLPITLLQIAADLARTRALTLNTRAMLANSSAEGRSRLTRVPATLDILNQARALAVQRAGMIASTTATGLGAIGMRLFGSAVRFALGPVGIIITVIGLLVAAVVWAYNNVGWFRDLVNGAFAVIGQAAKAVGGWFVWLWQNAISPALSAIGNAVSWVWNSYISPIFQLVGAILGWVGKTFSYLWTGYISPVFQLIGAIFTWWYGKVVFPIIGFVVNLLVKGLGATFSWLWSSVISPVFGWIGALFSAWWNGIVRPIFGFVVGYVRDTLGPIFTWVYKTIIQPTFSAIGTVVRTVWEQWLKPVFDKIVDVAKVTIPAAFSLMKDGIGKAWDLVKDVVKAPIRFVVDTVINDALIGNFNKLADIFHTDRMPPIKLPKGFASGGYTGDGGKHEPKGVVHGGEFVLTKEETSRLGLGRINLFRKGLLPGYADGGLVGAATGAWDWIAGKAGKAWNWAADAAGTAASIVSDPAGTIGRLAKSVIGSIPGAGAMVDIAKGFGGKVLDGIIAKISGLGGDAGSVFGGDGSNGRLPSSALAKALGFAPGGGVGASGGLLRKAAAAAWNAAYAASGGILRLTEGYRDLAGQNYRWSLFKKGGNLAAQPGTSIHGFGDAADVAGGQSWLRSNGARFGWVNTGLGFSQREPWHFEFKGAPSTSTGGRGGVPLYDNGGVLPPGMSLVANKTGKPEAVLTSEQWQAIRDSRTSGDRGEVHFHHEGRDFTVDDYMEAEHRMEVLRG